MIDTMDVTTFAALSVAYHIAFRALDDHELESVKQKDRNILARASKVMSRVSFVDEIRYSLQIDLANMIQGMNRTALETYLLCTCFDTLAGNDDYLDIQSWLRTERATILGISERQNLLQEAETDGRVLSRASFSSIVTS